MKRFFSFRFHSRSSDSASATELVRDLSGREMSLDGAGICLDGPASDRAKRQVTIPTRPVLARTTGEVRMRGWPLLKPIRGAKSNSASPKILSTPVTVSSWISRKIVLLNSHHKCFVISKKFFQLKEISVEFCVQSFGL